MRSLQLHTALGQFVEQAAARLQSDILAGQEIPFELDSRNSRGRGAAPLYCYRPLTGAFIAERFPTLRKLDGYTQAAGLIDGFEGLDRYLLAHGGDLDRRGGRDARVSAALLALLEDVFDEQSDFEMRPERLERALARLDGSLLASETDVTLVATLHGLTIASREMQLTRGLLLAHTDALHGAPADALCGTALDGEDHLLVVFTAADADAHTALAQGKAVVGELLRALRLFGDGRIALGGLAWTRIGSGPWSTIALDHGRKPHGMLLVTAEQEDELRAFCNLVSRRAPHANEMAWALRRFEMGCGRESEYEALSDHLMALRVLLEPEGPASGLLAGRVAALCATPEQRTTTIERVLEAIALEHDQITGKTRKRAHDLELVRALSNDLRALLRDVICGHLPADLVSLADELLLSGQQIDEQAVLAEQDDPGEQMELAEQMLGDDLESAEILNVAV